jgi:hypothetical protein
MSTGYVVLPDTGGAGDSPIATVGNTASVSLNIVAEDLTGNVNIAASGTAAASGYFAALTEIKTDGLFVSVPQTGVRASTLTGYATATGAVAATDTVLQAFEKIGGNLVTTNALLASGFQKITTYTTVVAAKSGQPISIDDPLCYIKEKEALYTFCSDCPNITDDDLVLTTGAGGNSRWEMLQKVSRHFGDTGMVNWDAATLTILDPVLPAVVPTIIRLNFSTIATVAIKSVRYDLAVGNHDLTISGASGLRFVYFDDGSGVLKSRTDFWDFNTQAPVAIVYWSGTAIVGAQTEFHGIRDTVWHYYAHQYFGAQYKSGMAFTSATPVDSNANPPNATVQYLWSTTGYIQDEDALVNVGVGNWLQTLGSGLTSADAMIVPFYYYNGTFITTMAAMADRTPFIHAGGNTTPQWESAGTLTASVTGDYIVYHYFASPQIAGAAIFARPHNAKFANLVTAQAARPASLTWTNVAEVKHLYSAVFRVNTTAFTNSPHRCKIASLQDFRTVAGGPVAASNPTSHAGLSGLSDPNVHPASSITTDTTGFDKNLTATDTNLQLVATAFDEFDALPSDATNASLSPDLTNKVAFATSASGTSATFTFGTRGAIEFLVDANTLGGMTIACDYKATGVNALSDPSNLFLATDAGTGIVVTKSANSAAVTLKNRLGVNTAIGVLAIRASGTATAWS